MTCIHTACSHLALSQRCNVAGTYHVPSNSKCSSTLPGKRVAAPAVLTYRAAAPQWRSL